MISVGGKNGKTGRLMQADVPGEGAIGCSHQHFLPIAGVAATAHLKVLTETFEMGCALEQALAGLVEGWTAFQPVGFGQTMVGQLLQPFKSCRRSELLSLEPEHGEGLIKGPLES